MKKAIGGGILIAILATAQAGSGMPARDMEGLPQDPSLAGETIKIRSGLYFSEVVLHRENGEMVRGRLIAVVGGAIRIQVGRENFDVPARELVKAVVYPEKRRSRGLVPGIALGLYVGNALMTSRAARSPDESRQLDFFMNRGSHSIPGVSAVMQY